jgi:hypothetical protein
MSSLDSSECCGRDPSRRAAASLFQFEASSDDREEILDVPTESLVRNVVLLVQYERSDVFWQFRFPRQWRPVDREGNDQNAARKRTGNFLSHEISFA